MTWGIIPAAGTGSRIHPLAFSKELLPVGSRIENGVERPRAVSEYLIERMVLAGASKICFVISPAKSDILEYFGGGVGAARFAYVVQQTPVGVCDAIFQALPLIAPEEDVLVGLPDTIWYPVDGLAHLPDDGLSFLCFPVDKPQQFDAVVTDEDGRVLEVQVKAEAPTTNWIWGAFRVTARVLRELHALWLQPGRGDAYIGTLVNAWLARGGHATAIRAGSAYVDVGTLNGWHDAVRLLEGAPAEHAPVPHRELALVR